MNKERLLLVARALRESPNPGDFTMATFGFGCGTPACALGHYAARADLQNAFALDAIGNLVPADDDEPISYSFREVLAHFGINSAQADELFSAEKVYVDAHDKSYDCGCGGALSAIDAALYIENFVRDNP